MARGALLQVAKLSPKPGLADGGRGEGLDAIQAITPWLGRFFAHGVAARGRGDDAFLDGLRELGRGCERDVAVAADGASSHKGWVFSMGLLCGCTGTLAVDCLPDPEQLCAEVARVAEPLVERELARNFLPTTAGERLFALYGLTGARGEAASGYATVRKVALPAYLQMLAKGYSDRIAMFQALLVLMAENLDTDVVASGGLEGLRFVETSARQLLDEGGMAVPDCIARLEALDAALVARNLCPRGSVDLLAVTWFLARLPTSPA